MNDQSFQAQLEKSTGKSAEASTGKFVSKRKTKKKEELPSIQNNPFAKIAMSTPDPQRQKDQMVKLMTYVDAETTAANNKALSEYSAYMQSERQRLAVELITMTDTKTFSVLQGVLMDINNGVLDFEEQIKPFMEIINAVRLIQEEDATTDILSEMREDGKVAEELNEKLTQIGKQIAEGESLIRIKRAKIATESDNKGLFGFGGIKSESLQAINMLKVEIKDIQTLGVELSTKVKELKNAKIESTSKFSHLADAKKIMATMLDLSGGEHEERHEKLVKTAVSFVSTTKARVEETLLHSVKMGGQINELSNLAFTMRGSYNVLSEAAKEAETINSSAHDLLKAELEGIESPLERMTSEKVSRDMAKHITALNDSATETAAIISDLTVSSQRIETMEAANIAQIKKTEQIQTSGIAGVADNLSSVLTAINQAAIGQSSTAAQQSLRRMNDNTITLTKEGMLNSARASKEDNAALQKSLIQLTGFGEVIDITNAAALEALEENRELVSELSAVAGEVSKSAAETLDIASATISEERDQ